TLFRSDFFYWLVGPQVVGDFVDGTKNVLLGNVIDGLRDGDERIRRRVLGRGHGGKQKHGGQELHRGFLSIRDWDHYGIFRRVTGRAASIHAMMSSIVT